MPRTDLCVFKFGGASVKNADAIRNADNIFKESKQQKLVVVVSAIGKSTNALEEVVKAHSKGKDGRVFLQKVQADHYKICQELFGDSHPINDQLNDIFVEADWVLDEPPHESFDYMYDQIVSVGELASSRILSAYLQETGVAAHWLDARDVVKTDNLYREAWVEWDATERAAKEKALPIIEQNLIPVTQGFIGSSSENFTTTLGREGSDYTAAILSYCLDAKEMVIWKDVPGVLTADPRKFEKVTKLDRLSYREAIEMTYYGAKVIHPKTIKPLQNKSIPLLVKSFIDPDGTGTKISSDVVDNYPPMVAIEEVQALLNISTRDFSFVAEHHLSQLFKLIAKHRLQVHMMQNTAISFAVSVSDVENRVNDFAKAIEKDFIVQVERGVELITIRHYSKEILKSLQTNKIVLLEERMRNTIQMVVKNIPLMVRK